MQTQNTVGSFQSFIKKQPVVNKEQIWKLRLCFDSSDTTGSSVRREDTLAEARMDMRFVQRGGELH